MQSQTFDTAVQTVSSIINSNDTARSIFEHLANRKREVRNNVFNIEANEYFMRKDGASIDHAECLETFKKLEQANIGRLVVGRNGKNSRFEAKRNLRALAIAALGGQVSEPAKTETPKVEAAPVETPQPEAKATPQMIVGGKDTSKMNEIISTATINKALRLTKSGKVDKRQFNKGQPVEVFQRPRKAKAQKTETPKVEATKVAGPVITIQLPENFNQSEIKALLELASSLGAK